jgi:16S rRNA (cytosine1402-N4)-methyltransferase
MSSNSDGIAHRPALYHEIILALQPGRGDRFVDCTLGAGGHAWGILEASSPDGRLLGMDVDPEALDIARQRLAPFGSRAVIVQASYMTLSHQLKQLGWRSVKGVLLDLGLSSMQLDTPKRGFSFQVDAPLDMRFDPGNPVRAVDLVNTLSEVELTDLLVRFGEERNARMIAHAIVRSRPLASTKQLAEVVAGVSSKAQSIRRGRAIGKSRIHPATRTFQALRIAVNRELEALEETLPQALEALAPGGRLAVISFHSLEDRIVKQYFRQESKDCLCPPPQPICTCGHKAILIEVNRHPIRPSPSELEQNPRSRSARLRIAERI